MQIVDEKVFAFAGHMLDLRRGCLRKGDREIRLRAKSFAVLRYLVENAGRLVPKDELIAAIWPNVVVTDVSLARCVSDVRLALGDQAQRIIKTTPRRGYLFAAPVSEAADEALPEEALPRPQPGEFRQLTIMTCELAGLASLSARLDPEDLREARAACHRRCTAIVERHHGYVARYAGNGLVAYFGYPEADEHDAENAVRAALALRGSEAALQPATGIATGMVVIGDEFAAGAATERTAVGETLTLSERLQTLAPPGEIVVGPSTRRLAQGLFEYRDLGSVELKGLAVPVEAAQVLGESAAESRFEARHPAALTPLVGREEELDLLLRRWREAKAGEGAVVLLAGEAGIGKSRIAQTLVERLGGEEHARLRLFCSPHYQDSALHPSISQLERAAGFRRSDSDAQKLARLEAALAPATSDLADAVPLLAALLGIPTSDCYKPLNLTPQQRKERTLAALMGQVERLAALRPMLLVIEDVHWADPTSLELIDLVVERASRLRLLAVITFRPEFASPWAGRLRTTPLTVGRLPARQCAEIIAGVIQGKTLPRATVGEILERADGVPLFVEELTKAVIESGASAPAGAHDSGAERLPAPAIPMTLRASLLARLDRLTPPAREAAQIGAALGRRFSHALIAAVAAMPQHLLDEALARLVSAELIWRRGSPPDAEYTFKHALVQDAAYGTLLREPRRALHAHIAETLEHQFVDLAESRPEMLAHHCTEAGLIAKAASLWGRAGQLSLTQSALKEAAQQLARALGQIASLPGTTALRAEQIKLQIALANALMHTKGYAAPETKAALDRARTLVEQAEALGEPQEDPLLLLSVLHGVWVATHVAFDGEAVRDLAVAFMALVEKKDETFPLVLGHRVMGTSLLYLGDIAESLAHFNRALALYDPAAHRPLATRFGHDVGVAILSNRPLALWLLGYPEAAVRDCEDALGGARDLGQSASYMYGLTRIASVHLVAGNYAAAAAQCRELIALAEETDGSYWKAAGTMIEGCLFALTGEEAAAIPLILSGMAAAQSAGAKLRLPWNLSCLARAYAGLGKLDDARCCLDEAMAAMATTRETWQRSDLHRIAGELALLGPVPDAARAEALFEQALAVARGQQARSWELRAAASLARLWRDQGKRRQGYALLAPILGGFTEGFDAPDLRDAKALMAELGS